MEQSLVSKTLGKYRIVARLGSGGMAEVYKAYQPGLDRYVAIKVMHSYLSADEEFVKRFRREAMATGKLAHPNIVQALDFDQVGDLYFMVMQFINGPTLKDELKIRHRQKQNFDLPDIARMYLAIGEAVDYAHHRGMIHRDLKPANMMIDEEGQLLLTDFGIARLLGSTQYTSTGAMIGTPAYMSPEQGRGAKVDGCSDIYTLGVILYEMVTGRVPYEADTPVAVVMKHLTEPLPPPHKLNPALSLQVEQVIVKAMAKEPEARYQTADELALALRDAVGLRPGDTLRYHPLRVIATPPKIANELDPTTGSFTPIGLGTFTPPDPQATVVSSHAGGLTLVEPSRLKILPLLIGGAVALLLVIGGLGLFLINRAKPSAVEQIIPTIQETGSATQTATALAQLDTQAATATADWLAGDNDRDGLTNAEEMKLGTLPDKRDTDQDNIDDADEVNLHRSNPLKSDSDGDGLKDGFEVSQGLNPVSADTDGDGQPDAIDPDPAHTPTATATQTPLPTDTPTPTSTPTSTDTPTPAPTTAATATSTPSPVSTAPPTPTPTPLDETDRRVAELLAQAGPVGGDKTGLIVVNCESEALDWYIEVPRNEARLVAKVPPFQDGHCGISQVEGFFITQNYDFGFFSPWMERTRHYLFTNLPPTQVGVVYFRNREAELRGISANWQFCPGC